MLDQLIGFDLGGFTVIAHDAQLDIIRQGFFEDMGYFDNTVEIDRIDNNKGYCKNNCRLVTPSVNSANRSSPRKNMLRGVYINHGKFRSVMRVQGKNYHLNHVFR